MKLNIATKFNIIYTEEQWEKDLDAELQDYELVTDASNSKKGPSDEEWEKDVEDLLGDTDDLK